MGKTAWKNVVIDRKAVISNSYVKQKSLHRGFSIPALPIIVFFPCIIGMLPSKQLQIFLVRQLLLSPR